MAATVTKTDIKVDKVLGGVPYGNLTALNFPLVLASGVWTDSDQATAVIAADTLLLGILPKGMTILDYTARISSVFTAASTMVVGFAYVDGVDDADVPQDADYFCASTSMASAAILKPTNTAVAPVTLPKDAYLTLLHAGATEAETASVLNITVTGICTLP